MWIGLFLVFLGLLYLLHNMGIIYGDVWNYAWPILLISIGLGIVFKNRGKTIRHEFHDDNH